MEPFEFLEAEFGGLPTEVRVALLKQVEMAVRALVVRNQGRMFGTDEESMNVYVKLCATIVATVELGASLKGELGASPN